MLLTVRSQKPRCWKWGQWKWLVEELAWITNNSQVNNIVLFPRLLSLFPTASDGKLRGDGTKSKQSAASTLSTKRIQRCNCNHQLSHGYTHHCSSLLLLARYLSLLICSLPLLPTNRRSSPFINKPTGILSCGKTEENTAFFLSALYRNCLHSSTDEGYYLLIHSKFARTLVRK